MSHHRQNKQRFNNESPIICIWNTDSSNTVQTLGQKSFLYRFIEVDSWTEHRGSLNRNWIIIDRLVKFKIKTGSKKLNNNNLVIQHWYKAALQGYTALKKKELPFILIWKIWKKIAI